MRFCKPILLVMLCSVLLSCMDEDQTRHPQPASPSAGDATDITANDTANNTPTPIDSSTPADTATPSPPITASGTLQSRIEQIENSLTVLTGKLDRPFYYGESRSGNFYEFDINGFSFCKPTNPFASPGNDVSAPGLSLYGCENTLSFTQDASDRSKLVLNISIPVYLFYISGRITDNSSNKVIGSVSAGYVQTNNSDYSIVIPILENVDGGFSLDASHVSITDKTIYTGDTVAWAAVDGINNGLETPTDLGFYYMGDIISFAIRQQISRQIPFADF